MNRRTTTELEGNVVPQVAAAIRSTRMFRLATLSVASLSLVAVGMLMVIMMIYGANKGFTEPSDVKKVDKWAPAPDWPLVLGLEIGMVVVSVVIGVLLQDQRCARAVRGTLEYTTIVMMDLKLGRRYKYKYQAKGTKDESPEDKFDREIHQLKVEAGIAGWSADALAGQLQTMNDAFAAKYDAEQETSKQELVKVEVGKMVSMVLRTADAMPLPFRINSGILALIVVGFGALGAFLMVGVANMPDPTTDALWIEISWQVINAIFSVAAIWKGPQRMKLFWYCLKRYHVEEIDGVQRSLLQPGVLLTHRQLMNVALLRVFNIVMQYCCSFFMWAYLSRCIQEEVALQTDCKSRPPWAVPVFLVPGFASDQGSNALLHHYIVNCPYIKWPSCDTPMQPVQRDNYLEREGDDAGAVEAGETAF